LYLGAIELMARCAAAHQPALAENAAGLRLALHPLAHEGNAGIEDAVEKGVGKTFVFALHAEADPGQHLRRTAEATPKAGACANAS
jgi:hypothetical protein